jgi:hypothetical protein
MLDFKPKEKLKFTHHRHLEPLGHDPINEDLSVWGPVVGGSWLWLVIDNVVWTNLVLMFLSIIHFQIHTHLKWGGYE